MHSKHSEKTVSYNVYFGSLFDTFCLSAKISRKTFSDNVYFGSLFDSFSGHANKNCNNNINQDAESVVNLSDLTLSNAQLSVLSRGLNFCPSPGEPPLADLFLDLDKFHRQLRRKCFFHKKTPTTSGTQATPSDGNPNCDTQPENSAFEHRKFRDPSSWDPRGPPTLETFIKMNEIHLGKYKPKATKRCNLSKEEKIALKELETNPNIVIKPADKGSAVVILSIADYIREAEHQLSDTKFYKKEDTNLTHEFNKDVKKELDLMFLNGEIGEKCYNYLYVENPRTALFYLLPKIHKGILPPPGRPILSANDCPTERISEFVDFFLRPLVEKLPSYIKDTTDLIVKLAALGTPPPNCLLVTLDVVALYPNIPILGGMRAIWPMLTQSRPQAQHPTNTSIMRLLELVLRKNNFEFNGQNYVQIAGTAMGTRMAPSFANLYMGHFEEEYVYKYPLQPWCWFRFIDDIKFLWPHGREELDRFINHLNYVGKLNGGSLQFTAQISETCNDFLDTSLYFTPAGEIAFKLYSKPTDKHNYLRYDSCHPKRMKESIPYSQFLRIRRICTELSEFDKSAAMIAKHFLRRGYPQALVEESLIKARRLDRSTLLDKPTPQNNDRTDEERFFLITTFNPASPNFADLITKNWDILSTSDDTGFLSDSKIIYGFRRSQNLKDRLCRARVKYDPNSTDSSDGNISLPLSQSTKICKNSRCRYCPLLNKTGRVQSTSTGRSYTALKNITCKSDNLVYLITCKKCGLQYVGQTYRTIAQRFLGHFNDISNERHWKAVGEHFNKTNHQGWSDCEISVLYFCSVNPGKPNDINQRALKIRKSLERYWQFQLQTLSPKGLNRLEE